MTQPDAFALKEQADWEVAGYEAMIKRYREVAATKDPSTLPGGKRLLRDLMPHLVTGIESLQARAERPKARDHSPWFGPILLLPADRVAVITLCVALRAAGPDRVAGVDSATVVLVAQRIAEALHDQVDYDTWVTRAKHEEADAAALRRFRREHPEADRRAWKSFAKRLRLARTEAWSPRLKMYVGTVLLNALLEASTEQTTNGEPYFSIKTISDGGGQLNIVCLSGAATSIMADLEQRAEVSRPPALPMLMEPLPWRYEDDGSATGGYVIAKAPLVRHKMHKHSAELPRCVSEADLQALNAVQSTPWRVNTFILDVMGDVWSRGLRLAGISPSLTKSLPDRMDDTKWDALPATERKAVLSARADVHAFNARSRSHSQALLDALQVADLVRNRPSIWFPYTRDWRGRVYPLSQAGMHPQSDDIGKSLLMFSAGLPLGPDGEYWLAVRAANTWENGVEKLPLTERVGWTLENVENIQASAADPIGHQWWTKAEKPWQFLATCYELSMAWAMEDPSEFVSHLPVAMDGTCNGLQHLSAVALDPRGAKATNLCAEEPRHDIYQEVADRVAEYVVEDAANGLAVATVWQGSVTRKVVKRAVMTTPYGVTDAGIRKGLLQDKLVPGPKEGRFEAAGYLGGLIGRAMGDTVSSAKEVMAWCRTTATQLAKAEVPFDWRSPSGSAYRQAYHALNTIRVATLCGKLTFYETDQAAGLNPRKQAAGSAPNLIHSFDAAHMALTVNAASEDGMRSFAMVHDSFATHARNTTTLARLLREQFVAIYSQDWLTRTYEAIRAYASHVDIPVPPARSTFDITSVLRAQFFFS